MGKTLSAILCIMAIWNLGGSAPAKAPMFSPRQLADLKATDRDIIVPKYLPEWSDL